MFSKMFGSFASEKMGRRPAYGTPARFVRSTFETVDQPEAASRRHLKGAACAMSILLAAFAIVLGGILPANEAYAQGLAAEVPTIRIQADPIRIDVEVNGTVHTETVPVYTSRPAPRYEREPAPTYYGTYIVADSDTRWYSRGELEYLSTYDLYLARNEIFARHGRLFVRDDLQRHFNAQSWYYGYIAPDDFDYGWLSSTEQHNVEVMKAIEESRNSPYL